MYLVAFRRRPWLHLPGAFGFTLLSDCVESAKVLYSATRSPVSVLSGPNDPRPSSIALDERAYVEVDAITRQSWKGSGSATRLTIREYAQILAAVKISAETAFGEYLPDNTYFLRVTASNPAAAAGLVTGAEGVSYDYNARIYYDPESDGGGSILNTIDNNDGINIYEPDATAPDPTPGLPAAPTLQAISDNTAAPIWQYRVITLASITAGYTAPEWSPPGAAEIYLGRYGASEPFRVEVQDAKDETSTLVYHGPNESTGSAPPPPGLSAIWAVNPVADPDIESHVPASSGTVFEQLVTANKPPGELWQADGGRLISVDYGGRFASPDGKLQNYGSRVPRLWVGQTDPNSVTTFASLYDDSIGGSTQPPIYSAYASALYGAGEPRRVSVAPKIAGGPTTVTIIWDHFLRVDAADVVMGTNPTVTGGGIVPTAPIPAASSPAARDANGYIGLPNTYGFDPSRNEYFITGVRNRLQAGVISGLFGIPGADVSLVTDDGGNPVGGLLASLTGTPLVTVGASVNIPLMISGGGLSIGPYIEFGTGGPHPFKVPL